MYEIRTDLALEAREKYEQGNVEIKGVRLEKEKLDQVRQEARTEPGSVGGAAGSDHGA